MLLFDYLIYIWNGYLVLSGNTFPLELVDFFNSILKFHVCVYDIFFAIHVLSKSSGWVSLICQTWLQKTKKMCKLYQTNSQRVGNSKLSYIDCDC